MSGDIFGGFYKPRKKIRRRYETPPPTREDVQDAVMEYLKDGGKITRLDKSPDPGELAQMNTASDFTSCEGLSLNDIF